MEDRALQHALEAERRLSVALFFASGQRRCGLFDEGFQLLAQRGQIHRTCLERFSRGRVAQQRQQQVLHGHKLVSVLTRPGESHVETEFQFLIEHKHLPNRLPYSGFFQRTKQRMLVLPCVPVHMDDFGFRHLGGKNTTDRLALIVDREHQLRCAFNIIRKELLQNVNHKFHRCVIVVVKYNFIHRRRFYRIDLFFFGQVFKV